MTDSNQGPVFRASKRRRVFRKRPDHDDHEAPTASNASSSAAAAATAATATPAAPAATAGVAEDEQAPLLSRHVRPTGTRKGGVAFSSTRTVNDSGTNSAFDTSVPPTPMNAVEHAQARFVAPTGNTASADDKHMMAYVDSKLARLTSSHEPDQSRPSTTATVPRTNTAARNSSLASSASHGHLQEVDVASTCAPTTTTTRAQKRLPRRNWRNRRTSADVARDALVDQIMRESQLNIYDAAPSSSTPNPSAATEADDNLDADERMAEDFKRNFFAAAEERRAVRRAAPPAPPTYGAKKPESSRGPKLGGSRSQRAAMHAMHAAEKAKSAKK